MNNSTIKLLGVIIILLGAYMLYFGISKEMPPPAITGVGFFFIGLIFAMKKN